MEELANATQQGGLHQLVSVRMVKSCPKVPLRVTTCVWNLVLTANMQDVLPAFYVKTIHVSGLSPVYFLGLKGIQEVLPNYCPVYTFGPVCGELEAFPIPF